MIRKAIAVLLLSVMIIAPPLTAVSGTVNIPGFYPTVKTALPSLPANTLPVAKSALNMPGLYSITTDATTS